MNRTDHDDPHIMHKSDSDDPHQRIYKSDEEDPHQRMHKSDEDDPHQRFTVIKGGGKGEKEDIIDYLKRNRTPKHRGADVCDPPDPKRYSPVDDPDPN